MENSNLRSSGFSQSYRHRSLLLCCKDSLLIKTTITILVVVSFLLLPKVGFLPLGAEGFSLLSSVVFPFSHANVFHLLCNIACLWQMRNLRNFILPAFLVQFLCSLLPETLPDIMGMSGFLFAIVGLKCGIHSISPKILVTRLAPFFIITAFIPNVAVLYHLYCLVVAYALGITYNDYCLWKALRL